MTTSDTKPMFSRDQLYNSMGVGYTKALFREFTKQPEVALFTVKKYDDADGYISLYKLYMEYAVDDPTEVTFSQAVFGDHSYWLKLRDMWAFKEYIAEWEKEAEQVRISRQIRNVLDAADDPKSKLSAAKFLLQEGFKFRPDAKDGRKARKENRENITNIAQAEAFKDDFKRMQEYLN